MAEISKTHPASSAPPAWARAMGILDACVYLGGISRAAFYRNLVGTGRIKLRKVGGRSVVLREDLDALLDGTHADDGAV